MTQNAPSPSPLAEANVGSLDEWFSRKPPYDAETLARIKAEFRRLRANFAKNGSASPKAKRAPKVAAATSTELDIFSDSPEATPDGSGAP